MPRRLVSLDRAADHLAVSERTIRNYIGEGFFPAYRVRGLSGLQVDLDEVDRAQHSLPSRRRASTRAYGPKARIVNLNVPVVVKAEPEDKQ